MIGAVPEPKRKRPCTAAVLLTHRAGTVVAQLTWQSGLVGNPRDPIRRVQSC